LVAALADLKFGVHDSYPYAPLKLSLNPVPPSDAVRKQKKNILEDIFHSVLSQFKKM